MPSLGEIFDATSIPNFGPPFEPLPDLPALNELRAYRQWVGWKWERRETAAGWRWTKPPVNPFNGYGASHTKPNTWNTYERAVQALELRDLAGVGFVLTEADPYIGIDLDKCRDPDTGVIEPWARDILDIGETYAEVSPSETGIRLIARGAIEKVTKCDPAHVEIYDKWRYVTITGRHVEGTPGEIREAGATIAALLARVATFRPAPEPEAAGVGVRPVRSAESGPDFYRVVNDTALANLPDWVTRLFPGARRMGTTYRITSKMLGRDLEEDLSITPQGAVDFGVHDMGDAREGKRTPIDLMIEHGGAPDATDAALLLCDWLGLDAEDLGWQDGTELARLGAEIAERLDQQHAARHHTPAVHETPEDERHTPISDEAFPDHLTRVPGLLGELVDWICASARRPNRTMALAAAIVIVGTAMGRYRCGPTRSSTVTFVLVPAASGTGKDHPMQCIKLALTQSGMGQLIGADEFASGPAVISLLKRMPLSACCMDEFGSFLRRINGGKSSSWEKQITKYLRTAWGTNFGVMAGQEQAQSAGVPIYAPHLSIYGTGVPEEIFQALEGGDVANGFINRFLYMPVHGVIERAAPTAIREEVPQSIKDALRVIFGGGNDLQQAQLMVSGNEVRPVAIDWADPALGHEWDLFDERMIALANNDRQLGPFVARTAEMAVRLATIRAQGVSPYKPKISRQDWEWAQEVALWSAYQMARACGLYIADTESQADANRIIRIVRDFGGRATKRMILQRLKHRMRARELDDVMKLLLESGTLTPAGEDKPSTGGRPKVWYSLRDQ